MSETGIITVTLSVLAAIVWAVRVEGIVRAHDKEIAQLRRDMEHKIDAALIELRYIRERVDAIAKGRA